MKRNILILTVIALMLCLTACGNRIYPDLPEDPISFEMGVYLDPDDPDDAGYGTLEYEGRTYIVYGTLGKTLHKKDIDQCIGYIVMDENSSSVTDPDDKNTRVYTLADDPEHNYLMEYDSIFMNIPSFWRAMDTQGKNIADPAYIDSLKYFYWESPPAE